MAEQGQIGGQRKPRACPLVPVVESGFGMGLARLRATVSRHHAVRMRHSVLVVDDDEGFLQMVTRLLELRGFTVVAQAASRADALAVLRRCRPDSVLVDVNLPDGDGLTLAREVARRPDPPRIVLTSSDDLKLGASVLTSAGIHAFALKDTLVQIDLYALFIGP